MTKKLVVAMSTACLDYYPYYHEIYILPLNIKIGKETYIDGKTITAEQLEDWMLKHPNELARTSPPNPNTIAKFFAKVMDEGYEEVLFISMSSELSKTVLAIKEAIQLFAGRLKIHVFDTKSCSFPEGFMALEAERYFQKGMTMENTLARLRHLRRNNTLMFAVNELNYLVGNGRLSATAGFVANALNIKPIITINSEGQAVVTEKIMSFKRAMYNMTTQLKGYMKKTPGRNYVYLLYTGKPREWFHEFEQLVEERCGLKDLPAFPISPVVSAHSGPNSVGFGIFWDYDC